MQQISEFQLQQYLNTQLLVTIGKAKTLDKWVGITPWWMITNRRLEMGSSLRLERAETYFGQDHELWQKIKLKVIWTIAGCWWNSKICVKAIIATKKFSSNCMVACKKGNSLLLFKPGLTNFLLSRNWNYIPKVILKALCFG